MWRGVRGRVAVRGVVAAADVTAGEADPQVQPLAAVAQAVLAAVDGRGELAQLDLVEVSAERRSSDSSFRSCEVRVDELHSHRPFADGGGATFGRAGADVAGGEDAGHARLEQVVGAGCVAGEDEAVGGACDSVVEPLRARLRAEEEEEEGEREALAALERDRFELASVPWRAAISLRSRTATP